MILLVLQAGLSLVLLYFGGEWLIRGASSIASRLGVSRLAIGLTVVAFGTSAPELVVSLDAALAGSSELSVGNVVGSNIANIALILGLAAAIRASVVQAKIIRIDAPIMIGVSLALAAILADGTASRAEGAILVAGLVAYTVFTFWEAGRESEPVKAELAAVAPGQVSKAVIAALLIVAGLGLLVVGGHLLVGAAVDIALALGVSHAVIGLTIVAVGTSLPEFVTSVIATMRGYGDIAIGNVVGSNIFNILGILGVTALVQPLDMGAISWFDVGTMIALAALVTVFITTQGRLSRIEGGILFTIYVAYAAWLVGGA